MSLARLGENINNNLSVLIYNILKMETSNAISNKHLSRSVQIFNKYFL